MSTCGRACRCRGCRSAEARMSNDLPATDDFELKLRELGAGFALTQPEREQLDRQGFVALTRALPMWIVNALLERLDRVRLGGDRRRSTLSGEAGCWRIDGLLGLNRDFHFCWSNARVLAAI